MVYMVTNPPFNGRLAGRFSDAVVMGSTIDGEKPWAIAIFSVKS